MYKEEMMRSLGIDPSKFTRDVSEPELGKQLGNAMAQNVMERLLQRVLPAAGFMQKLKKDRWTTGDAVRDLENSRDKTMRHTANFTAELRPRVVNSGLHEFYSRSPNAGFKFPRLPNQHGWIRCENVKRVIHRDANSGDVVFDEPVTDSNRNKIDFWERPCSHGGGLLSILLYKGDKPCPSTAIVDVVVLGVAPFQVVH